MPTLLDVKLTDATLMAMVENQGDSVITEAGIVYSIERNPDNSCTKIDSPTVVGAYKVNIAGLLPNGVYYYRGYATNSFGTNYSEESSFITLPNAPVAVPATNITNQSFMPDMTFSTGNGGISRYIDVATDDKFSELVAGYSDHLFSWPYEVVGLNGSTTYYYRFRVVNPSGTSPFSNTIAVTTLPAKVPILSYPDLTSVTTNTAAFSAVVESSEGSPITDAGVVYGLTRDRSDDETKVSSPGSTRISANVAGLSPNTEYHFRGYATNSQGTGFTRDVGFATRADPPSALAATGVCSTGFTANWTVPPGTGDIYGYLIDVATDEDFANAVSPYKDYFVPYATSLAVTGLNPEKTYYYRVRARDEVGSTGYSNSVAATTVSGSSIVVTYPTGEATWSSGQQYTITWACPLSPGRPVKIDLLRGDSITTIIPSVETGENGTGYFQWMVPTSTLSGDDYKVKITSVDDQSNTALSDGNFTISGTGITVKYPSGGETLKPGKKYNIKWNYTGIPGSNVKIELINNGIVHVIKSKIGIGKKGVGSCAWTIPKKQAMGDAYAIRITSNSNRLCTDTSDGVFSIRK